MKRKPITEMTKAESRLYTAKLNLNIATDVIKGETTAPADVPKGEYISYLIVRAMTDLIEYFEIKEQL